MIKLSRKGIIAFGSVSALLVFLTFFIPFITVKKGGPYSYAVYDKNGILLGAQVAADDQWRFESGPVPEKFARAIVLFEDKRFYIHHGIDFLSIARAVFQNIKSAGIVSGGSTITMQTVRLLERRGKRTYLIKLHEAFVALFMELRYSKKHILSLYCAHAPFGGNIVGLEAASWRYFNRSPESLTWAECATLAVLPNQPSLVYPGLNSHILLTKRNFLLHKLYSKGYMDRQEYELALQEILPDKPYPIPLNASHYLGFLRKTDSKHTKHKSDIDTVLQKNTVRVLEDWSHLFSLKGINNAAAIIIDNKTEKIVAYCGNTGAGKRNITNYQVDNVRARRSSGSILKPFLYCAMLDSGQILPEQLVIDTPIRIGNYKPDNNIPVYRGAVPAGTALTLSLNLPAVRALREYGINAFLDYLRKVGFTTLNRSADDYGLPLILGGGEVTLYETAMAYARMMNCAQGISDDFPSSRANAYLTLQALAEGDRPTEEANWKSYADSKKIAWKTGTSSGNRDAWAVGTTCEYTVGVWVGNSEGFGNPDLKSFTTAAPVMFDIFSGISSTTWPLAPILDFTETTVCEKSGYVASRYCEHTKVIYTSRKSPVGKICPYCRAVSFTPDGRYQAQAQDLTGPQAGIYDGKMPLIKNMFVLPPNIEYWYKKSNFGYVSLPEFVSWHVFPDLDTVSILFPEPGAIIIIPVEITGQKGAMIMQAVTRNPDNTLYWDIDGEYIGETVDTHELSASPSPGKHVLTVTDSMGNYKKRNFEIVREKN